jgi:adenosine deaminase
MYEDDPAALMKKMADKGVLVEINLTSNADILGVSGKDHPFPLYRKFAVPVALATDDEGIERIDLTNEYVRAVKAYGLTYADLKQIVRNSLEYDFLPGASLWDGAAFQRVVADCRGDTLGAKAPSLPVPRFSRRVRRRASNGSSSNVSRPSRPVFDLSSPLFLRLPRAGAGA